MKINTTTKLVDYLLFLVIILLFFYLNYLIPYVWDDFGYSFMCIGLDHDFSHPIRSISDAILSQINHYQNNTGRFPIHVVVQYLCGLNNKIYFNVLMLVFAPFWMLLLQKLCFPNKIARKNLTLAITLTFLFSICNTGQNAFYLGVAFGMNYTYGTLICLLYIYLLQYHSCQRFWNKLLLCTIGFLAGWSQETIAIGVAAYVFIFCFIQNKRLQIVQYVSIIFFYIGLSLLIFAPGNFVRQSLHQTGLSIIYLLPFIFIFLLIACYLWCKQRTKGVQFAKDNLPALAAYLILILFFLVLRIPIYGRMLIGLELFGFILLIRLIDTLGFSIWLEKLRYLGCFCCVVFLVFIIHYQIEPAKEMKDFYALCENPEIHSVEYTFYEKKCPKLFSRYIFQFRNEEYWDPLYSIRYHKPIQMSVHHE